MDSPPTDGRTGGGSRPPWTPHCFRLRRYGRRISLKSQLMAERNSQLMAEYEFTRTKNFRI